jgi:hypothetical protein
VLNSTVGTFAYDGSVFCVEAHTGTVAQYLKVARVRGEGRDHVAVIMLGPHGVIAGVKAEPGWEASVERLDMFRQGASEVLEAAAAQGRGPWATLQGLG